MKTLFVGIVGIAVGSSFSMLLMQTAKTSSAPCQCVCSCPLDGSSSPGGAAPVVDTFEEAVRAATTPPLADWEFPHIPVANQCPPVPACPAPTPCHFEAAPFVPPAAVNVEETELALTKWHRGKWGGATEGRARALCYMNNNQKLIDQNGKETTVFDLSIWNKLDGAGQLAAFKQYEQECTDAPMRVNWKSTVNDRFRRIAVNGKVVSLDDVVFGYERVFQSLELFSSVSWLGVSMQQTPNDAFVIADMLWRLRPDLFIELGTSGGGSAAFWAHVMAQYNPNAKVLTMDPSIQGAGSQKSAPLQPWNYGAVKRFCPHCIAANESKAWKRGNIQFLKMFPDSPEALTIASKMASQAKRVLVMEDSTHEKPVVLANVKAYGQFVTPGSYLIVQDTRCGRWKPADAVAEFLTLPEGARFSVDPRWEYMVFSQHNGGFLRKEGTAGPAAIYPQGPEIPNVPNQFA